MRFISMLGLLQLGACTIDVTNSTDFTVALVLRRVAVALVSFGLFDRGDGF